MPNGRGSLAALRQIAAEVNLNVGRLAVPGATLTHVTLDARSDANGTALNRLAADLSGALLELTTLHGKDDLEVARLLRSLVPSTTREARARRELAALGDLLSAGRVAARFEVAEIGVYANMADVERDLAAFLARFATPDDRV